MIQPQNDYIHSQNDSFNRLETQKGHLVKTVNDRKKTLPNLFLTIPDSPNHINRNQESWCLENFNQDSIPPQHIELDQSQTLDKLISFHFKKIELEYECDPNSQLCDSIPFF